LSFVFSLLFIDYNKQASSGCQEKNLLPTIDFFGFNLTLYSGVKRHTFSPRF